MKNLNSKLLVAVLVCQFSVSMTDAHANIFDKIKDAKEKVIDGSKKAADKAREVGGKVIVVSKEVGGKVVVVSKEVGGKLVEVTKDTINDVNTKINESNNNNNNNNNTPNSDKVNNGQNPNNNSGTTTVVDSSQGSQISQSSQTGQRKDNKNLNTKAQQRDERTSLNSIITLEGQTNSDINWLMFRFTKDNENYYHITEVKNGQYSLDAPLRLGAGTYQLEMFKNATNAKYSSYTQMSVSSVVNEDSRDMSYLLPSESAQTTNDEIISLAEHITRNATSDREKIVLINEWMKANIFYDYQAYETGSYKQNPMDAVSILNDKKAVCSGYANLFAALARVAGVRTQVIYGQGYTTKVWAAHAWNKVLIDGQWLNIDTTWNHNLKNNKYLLINDDTFSRDHKVEQIMESM